MHVFENTFWYIKTCESANFSNIIVLSLVKFWYFEYVFNTHVYVSDVAIGIVLMKI